jgi:hypothetical protein
MSDEHYQQTYMKRAGIAPALFLFNHFETNYSKLASTLSFPRKRESRKIFWMPVFTSMTFFIDTPQLARG